MRELSEALEFRLVIQPISYTLLHLSDLNPRFDRRRRAGIWRRRPPYLRYVDGIGRQTAVISLQRGPVTFFQMTNESTRVEEHRLPPTHEAFP